MGLALVLLVFSLVVFTLHDTLTAANNAIPKNIFFISFSLFNKKAHTKCMGFTPIFLN
jgi:hypothetical protein